MTLSENKAAPSPALLAKLKAYAFNYLFEKWLPAYTAYNLVQPQFSKSIPQRTNQEIQKQQLLLQKRLTDSATAFREHLTTHPNLNHLQPCAAVEEWEQAKMEKTAVR
jgi:hypothetical protein